MWTQYTNTWVLSPTSYLTGKLSELLNNCHYYLDESRVLGRMDTCIWMAESLCCPPETITTLLIGYIPMQNKKSKITAIRQTIIFSYKHKWYTTRSYCVADRTICNIPVIKHNQRGYEEECICVGVTESSCCISESNTMLQRKPTSKTEHTAVWTKCSCSPSANTDLTFVLSLPSPSFLTGSWGTRTGRSSLRVRSSRGNFQSVPGHGPFWVQSHPLILVRKCTQVHVQSKVSCLSLISHCL